MMLEALVACAGVTVSAVATAMGVKLRGGRVIAEGHWDARGTLGVDREAPGEPVSFGSRHPRHWVPHGRPDRGQARRREDSAHPRTCRNLPMRSPRRWMKAIVVFRSKTVISW